MFIEVHDGEDMYEPVLVHSDSEEDALEAVHHEISTVQEQFHDFLRDDDMGRDELESVERLLSKHPADPKKAARKGAELLEKVETRLKTAATDLQRFDDESQAAAVSTGYKVDRLAKALSAVMHARNELEKVSEW